MENLRCILERAKATNNHVTIDMESTDYTDATLQVYRALRQEFDNVGIVIQAYLYRSEADMKALAQEGAFVRLCKGAYKEPPDRAFPDKADVDANYVRLTRVVSQPEARAAGAYLGIATHDEKMINAAKAFISAHQVPYDTFRISDAVRHPPPLAGTAARRWLQDADLCRAMARNGIRFLCGGWPNARPMSGLF